MVNKDEYIDLARPGVAPPLSTTSMSWRSGNGDCVRQVAQRCQRLASLK